MALTVVPVIRNEAALQLSGVCVHVCACVHVWGVSMTDKTHVTVHCWNMVRICSSIIPFSDSEVILVVKCISITQLSHSYSTM